MTLNEWEQSNIEVLTSREMGEWFSMGWIRGNNCTNHYGGDEA